MARYKAAKHLFKHLLRCIRGTVHLALVFGLQPNHHHVLGYADADWVGCLDTNRSTYGYVFELYGGAISWKCKRQASPALSSIQAEVLAFTDATRHAEWLQQLLDDLGFGIPIGKPLPVHNDNMRAILLAQHPHSHHRTKQFDIRTSYIREKREAKTVSFNHIVAKENKPDNLTKAICPAEYFVEQRRGLGMGERDFDEQSSGSDADWCFSVEIFIHRMYYTSWGLSHPSATN